MFGRQIRPVVLVLDVGTIPYIYAFTLPPAHAFPSVAAKSCSLNPFQVGRPNFAVKTSQAGIELNNYLKSRSRKTTSSASFDAFGL